MRLLYLQTGSGSSRLCALSLTLGSAFTGRQGMVTRSYVSEKNAISEVTLGCSIRHELLYCVQQIEGGYMSLYYQIFINGLLEYKVCTGIKGI